MRELVEWQKIDSSNNLVFPWFTHPFLDVLQTWELKNKHIREYGGGRSTAWLRSKCCFVDTIETKKDFAEEILAECYDNNLSNGALYLVEASEADRTKERDYVKAGIDVPAGFGKFNPYDIVIVDGIFRYECMQEGIKLLSDRGGILIVDNWFQDGFLCPACVELMVPYEGHIYPQPDHKDHHGNCWKTAYFIITGANAPA